MIKRLLLFFLSALCLTVTAEAQTVRASAKPQTARIGAKAQPATAALSLAKNATARINVPKDDEPVYDPAGTVKHYIMSYTDNNGSYTNGKVEARYAEDGKTVYLNGLTPGYNRVAKGEPETWLKGTIVDGDLTLKAGQVLYKEGDRMLYFEAVQANDQGYISTFKDEMHFTVTTDGKITQTDADDIAGVFVDGETEEDAGFYGFFYNFALEDMGDIVSYAFPEGAEVKEYILSGAKKAGDTPSYSKAKLCLPGDGYCYASGLCLSSPDEVVRGKAEGTTVTFPQLYIIQGADLFYYRLVEGGEPDADGDLPLQDLVLTLDESTGAYAMASGHYLLETDYAIEEVQSYLTGVSLTPYSGDAPATPATPEVLFYDDTNTAIYVTIPATDTKGGYINPEKLSYRFYADDEPYTFTTDNYSHLSESLTDIPYAFTDHYDIFNNTGYKTVFFHNLAAKTLSVESVYTVDGTAAVSARASYTLPAGIDAVKAGSRPVSVTYTDLQGRRIAAPSRHGVTIVTTTYADGTVKTEKKL